MATAVVAEDSTPEPDIEPEASPLGFPFLACGCERAGVPSSGDPGAANCCDGWLIFATKWQEEEADEKFERGR